MTWEALSEVGRQCYDDFVAVAAAQLEIVNINVQGILTTAAKLKTTWSNSPTGS